MNVFKKLGFFTAFIIPILAITGYYLEGWWTWMPIFFSFLFIPVIDQLAGIDTSNVPDNEVKIREEEFYYRFVTYVWTYVQLAFVLWGCYAVTTLRINSIVEWAGFVISFSLVTGGIGITVAHELGHKKSTLERMYSKLLLMTVCYMHFYVEHNRGHHVQVATPHDPATARKNENFYSFWIRSVFKGYIHAWNLENESMKRNSLPVFHWKNSMIWFTVLPLVFCVLVTVAFSAVSGKIQWEIPLFFISQSVLAFTLLELVNYIEHYGILRREILPGKYERVNPIHSWNASHMISNFFLFQLQRHSDHHANAIKRYQVLNHYDVSPQLPYGYPTMILIAAVPPLWFGMMNKRLEKWASEVTEPMVR